MDFLSICTKKDQQQNNHFDRLPDDVIIIIFNKIQDAKTLVGSFSVNRRLASIIFQTNVVSLSLVIPRSSNSYLSFLSYSLERKDSNLYNSNNRSKKKYGIVDNSIRYVKVFIILAFEEGQKGIFRAFYVLNEIFKVSALVSKIHFIKYAVNYFISALISITHIIKYVINYLISALASIAHIVKYVINYLISAVVSKTHIVKYLVNYLITKLFGGNDCHDYIVVASNDDDSITNDFHCQHLKLFYQISYLHIEIHSDLPDIEIPDWVIQFSDDIFRWKAAYGSQLKTWTLLCCSLTLHQFVARDWWPNEFISSINHQFRRRKERINSCLQAALARHRLVKETVAKFPTLKTMTVTDAKKEGRLSMSEDEIYDLNESLMQEQEGVLQHVAPKLLLRIWYPPLLKLPVAECTWKEAMLIMIQPMDAHDRGTVPMVEEEEDDDGFDGDAEEKVMFAEAQREIMISSRTDRQAWWLRSTEIM